MMWHTHENETVVLTWGTDGLVVMAVGIVPPGVVVGAGEVVGADRTAVLAVSACPKKWRYLCKLRSGNVR